MLIRLTPEAFDRARENYGAARYIGRRMPREIQKSWTYAAEGYNTFARTPVTSAVESATGGDAESVTFHLFGDGTKPTPAARQNHANEAGRGGRKREREK